MIKLPAFEHTRFSRGALSRGLATLLVFGGFAFQSFAQSDDEEDEVYELSPFTVDGSGDIGYVATSTLAGTRLRSDLKDLGSAISVYTKEFMEDIGAMDNETLLSYTTSTEVGGTYSNYTGAGDGATLDERGSFNSPNSNTRVRGLNSADNTRNFFLTDVPWDSYNVDRIDMQRGPNSMLFGLGSPAGIINANTQDAQFSDLNKVELRIGSFGSIRGSFNVNRNVIEDQLAIRVAMMFDDRKFKQDPAHDDKDRRYVAVKYEPSFLKSKSSTFTIKGNFENGEVDSNRPRVLPPQDHITPFFRPVYDSSGNFALYPGLDGQTYDPFLVRRREVDLGDGQMQEKIEVDDVEIDNPNYTPGIGNYAQLFGGPLFIFDHPDSDSFSSALVTEINQRGGLAPDGSIDDNLATGFGRLTAPVSYVTYGQDANLPFSEFGQYKKPHLTDPTIFDFYNKLIDGPNKKEWSNWDVLNLSIAHTFLNNDLGYELSYYDQSYDDGRVGITGFNDAIYIDTNSHRTDGSVNPNAGRPFMSDSMEGGNQIREINRDSFRASAFYRLNFEKYNDGWLGRILGSHTFNGAYSEQSFLEDRRVFMRYRMEDAYYDITGVADGKDNINLINTTHYLGGSLLGQSSASGANISGIQSLQLPSSTSVRFFDTTWNAPSSVDPADPWDGFPPTQSDNPANYVGWTTRQFSVIDSLDGTNYNRMINSASLASSEVESEALVWQGFLLDHAIVATYGWREDTVETRQTNAPEIGAGNSLDLQRLKDVSYSAYNLDFAPSVETGQSRSWSIGVHVDRLPGGKFLPFNLSFYYNEGENFQPGAGRVDLFGHEVSSPFGNTVDKSVLIATKDGKYSLRVTDYETSVNNATSGYIDGSWFVGRFVAWGENWTNVFEHDISNGFTLDGVAQEGDNRTWRYQMKDPSGSVNADFEDEAVAAWRSMVNTITTDYADYVAAWKLDGLGSEVRNFGSQDPAGLAYTENTISTGQEYEFMAQPTPNWRIAVNASKTEAIRNNVGGAALIEWVDFVDGALKRHADYPNHASAGDIRIWSGGGTTIRDMWNSTFRSNYGLTELLEGTSTPELREWRFNIITNYKFTDGILDGMSVGGALRWEDDVVIGYPIATDAEGVTNFDLTKPYLGDSDAKLDFTLSYSKKLSDDLRWRIQLNVRNVFADRDLIPITVQPNGTPAALRIPEARTWSITNTFEF